MSKSQIVRFGRKCFSCNIRRRSVVSRAVPRIQHSKTGRSFSKPRTLLCDECAERGTRIGA